MIVTASLEPVQPGSPDALMGLLGCRSVFGIVPRPLSMLHGSDVSSRVSLRRWCYLLSRVPIMQI